MQQAWHIFQKDVLHLRRDIALYFGALLAASWLSRGLGVSIAEFLVVATSAYLIARLIHSDNPTGDRQFWITRPYRWASLLGAKILFILTVVNLPVLFVQAAILSQNSFAISATWRGLLWEQLLWLFGLALPVAALASITGGLAPFVGCALGVVLLSLQVFRVELHSTDWVRFSFAFLLAWIASTVVLFLQYRKRQTLHSRWIGAAFFVTGALACGFFPFSLAFVIQQRLSTQLFDPSSILVARDSTTPNWGMALARGKRVEVSIPLVIKGLPSQTSAKSEALDITLQAAGAASPLHASHMIVGSTSAAKSEVSLTAMGQLDREFFNAHRDQKVTLRGSLYVTLFGNKQSYLVSQHRLNSPVAINSQLRCLAAPYGVMCDAPLRWPKQRIDSATMTFNNQTPRDQISYSPFPADLRFYPFERVWAPASIEAGDPRSRIHVPDFTVEVSEPVSYVRRDFEIRDVPLLDIAVPWRSQRVSGVGLGPAKRVLTPPLAPAPANLT